MSAELPEVGTTIGPWEVPIKESTNQDLCSAVGSPVLPGGVVTPALAGNLNTGLLLKVLPPHILHTHQRIVLHEVAHVGDTLDVEGEVSSVHLRRGRVYATVQGMVKNRSGELIWEIEGQACVPDAPTEGLEEKSSTPLRIPEGLEPGASSSHTLTLEDQVLFSGPGNFHSDIKISRQYGYELPIAQGVHLLALGFDLLGARNPDWPYRGILDARFIGQAGVEDTVDTYLYIDRDVSWLEGKYRDNTVAVGRYQNQ